MLHQLLVVIQMEATCFQMSHALAVEEEDRILVVKATMSWLASVEPKTGNLQNHFVCSLP
jgi:predicted aconitase with swiveling domain